MFHKNALLLIVTTLAGMQAHAAVSDSGVADTFAYCAAVAVKGKQSSSNPNAQQFFGSLYTKYLWSALAFAPLDDVKVRYQAAVERHDKLMHEGKSSDELASLVVATLKECVANNATNAARIDSFALPAGKNGGKKLSAEPGKTSPLEVIGTLGKPFHEDYNPDGRFVYNYQTATGSDVYLFDIGARLILVRTYCDALKGKCPQ